MSLLSKVYLPWCLCVLQFTLGVHCYTDYSVEGGTLLSVRCSRLRVTDGKQNESCTLYTHVGTRTHRASYWNQLCTYTLIHYNLMYYSFNKGKIKTKSSHSYYPPGVRISEDTRCHKSILDQHNEKNTVELPKEGKYRSFWKDKCFKENFYVLKISDLNTNNPWPFPYSLRPYPSNQLPMF